MLKENLRKVEELFQKKKISTYESYVFVYDILLYGAIYMMKFWSMTKKQKDERTDRTTDIGEGRKSNLDLRLGNW